MQRVQAAIKEQLTHQREKLEIELREKVCTSIVTCYDSNLYIYIYIMIYNLYMPI